MEHANDLKRFVDAQESVYPAVLEELRQGKKQTHWMWFVFPQIAGLGTSSTAIYYSLKSLEEAAAYLQHPILGPRLRECLELLSRVQNKSAYEILGSPDDRKLQSCLTLFSIVAPEELLFKELLEKFYAGEQDARTVQILRQ